MLAIVAWAAAPLKQLGIVNINMFFNKPTVDQAVSLAAVFQSCELVAELAHTGNAPIDQMQHSMEILLNQNPLSIEQLYGPLNNLSRGFQSMRSLFGEVGQPKHPEVMRYVLLIIYLAGKLAKDKHRLKTIADGIEQAARQAEHFSATHDNVFSSVAELYAQSVSTLSVRIQVVGSANYLRQPAIAQRIRSQLFGAIRNAFLWRQLGGSQFHIMMRRKALANALPAV